MIGAEQWRGRRTGSPDECRRRAADAQGYDRPPDPLHEPLLLGAEARELLKKLGIATPKAILAAD